jgi:hypothetical protein
MGVKLAELLEDTGVSVALVHPGKKDPKYPNATVFLIDQLLQQ